MSERKASRATMESATLLRRRAESVENYLAQNLGVSRGRIITQWYGESAPVASNATPEGRRMNRRVEAMVLGLD